MDQINKNDLSAVKKDEKSKAYQQSAEDPGRKPGGECLNEHDLDVFSSVPRLPAWSFQRLICRGVLPPPHSPDKSGAAVSPADKS